ncbi:MAG: transcriptional regulator, partial [Eubacteriaceae bacterium]|nr:transcriptional regulator [Eubacteriaceae bacterium]
IAVFDDKANTSFRDFKEFKGSIFEQMENALSYLRLCNRTKATIKGLERVEKTDYPEEALREALINALVHRDYGFSGSIIINVNDNKIEFISIGGLLPGLSVDDIRMGISQQRNKNLAEMFHRLHLIENYGTGIRKIYSLYENCSSQPVIDVTPNAFRITLPNMNEADEPEPEKNHVITSQMQSVLGYFSSHDRITDEEVQSLLGVKKTRAFEILQKMRYMGLIDVVGRGTGKYYLPGSRNSKH